ncbi:hypothetical protein [Candidatus Poriferisodalis sp.]|uniref:hypothetical protein n=1 Tax=Candidatus Poriferisodalis sp. TaxID=3101277 RepID=UPI003D14CA7C
MTQTLVFDTTTPNYFTLTGRLELLEQLCASFRCVTPSEVIGELAAGTVAHPELRAAGMYLPKDSIGLIA